MTLFTDPSTPTNDVSRPDGPALADDIGAIGAVEASEVTGSPAPEAPDRADAPVSEITERFLKVVLANVPLDRIEELHLFSPLRQGGVETGIAVIAARVPVAAVEQPAAPELPFDDAPIEDVVGDRLDDGAGEGVEAVLEAETIAPEEDAPVIEVAPPPRIRHTVYTARCGMTGGAQPHSPRGEVSSL